MRGASPEAGVDWSDIADASSYEALCFVDHSKTGTQAGFMEGRPIKKVNGELPGHVGTSRRGHGRVCFNDALGARG